MLGKLVSSRRSVVALTAALSLAGAVGSVVLTASPAMATTDTYQRVCNYGAYVLYYDIRPDAGKGGIIAGGDLTSNQCGGGINSDDSQNVQIFVSPRDGRNKSWTFQVDPWHGHEVDCNGTAGNTNCWLSF